MILRDRVLRAVNGPGPQTASSIAADLEANANEVRRILTALVFTQEISGAEADAVWPDDIAVWAREARQ